MTLRQLGKSAILYAIGNVGIRAAAFLLIPLYTHTLSVGDYGLLTTLQFSMQISLIIMNSGMRMCLLRFAHEFHKERRIHVLVGTSTLINLISGSVITAICFLFLLPFFQKIFHVEPPHAFVAMLCAITLAESLTMHLTAYYRAQDQPIKFMSTGLITAGILVAANGALLYVLHLGVMGALWASLATYLLILAFLLYEIFPPIGLGASSQLLPVLFRFGFPTIFSEFGLLVMGGAGVYFLSYFNGLEDVAIFSLGSKLASILAIVLILPFQLAFQPYVYSMLSGEDIREKISLLFTYLLIGTAVIVFCILLGARFMLPLIAPPEYLPAYSIMLLLLPATACIGLYYVGETLLAAVKKTHVTGIVMIFFTALSTMANFLLTPPLGWWGAVIASNFSFGLVGVTFLILGRKHFFFPLQIKGLVFAVCSLGVFLGAFFVLRNVGMISLTSCALALAMLWLYFLFRLHILQKNPKDALNDLISVLK